MLAKSSIQSLNPAPISKYLENRETPAYHGDEKLQQGILQAIQEHGPIGATEISKLVHRSPEIVKMALVSLTFHYPQIAEDDNCKYLWVPIESWCWVDQ